MRYLMIAGLVVTALAPAQGSILPSSVLKFSGSMVVSSTAVTFPCNLPGDTTCVVNPPPNTGDITVGGSTGSFTSYNGTFGLIKNLSALQPPNTLFSLPNVITLVNNIATFDATFIPLGSNALSTTCAGLMHCTPQNASLISPTNPLGISAFNLDQDVTGTVATFLLQGTLHDTTGPDQFFTGTFTAGPFAGLNPQQTLALLLTGQAVEYQAQVTLTTATPEPGTITLLSLSILGLLWKRPRK